MSRDLFIRFKDFVENNRLIEPGEKLVLGVSGGPDSIFLLSMLQELAKRMSISFVVAHLNHCLREESGKEADFVEKVCAENKIRFFCERKQITEIFKGNSLEQTARKVRYDFFSKVAREQKTKKIVLAHHKDDLVETLILRLLRGSGMKGLRGILPYVNYENITVVRPLLSIEKQEILAYLDTRKISYMIDNSNFDESFLRNKVRHTVIPELEKVSSSVKNNLYILSKSITRDYDFIDSQSSQNFKDVCRYTNQGEVLADFNKLIKLHDALTYNIIRLAIQRAKGNLKRIDAKHIDEVISLIKQRPKSSVVDLPGVKVVKEARIIKFVPVV